MPLGIAKGFIRVSIQVFMLVGMPIYHWMAPQLPKTIP